MPLVFFSAQLAFLHLGALSARGIIRHIILDQAVAANELDIVGEERSVTDCETVKDNTWLSSGKNLLLQTDHLLAYNIS
jgi:hypothetical protein